jgi:antitoxin MazE
MQAAQLELGELVEVREEDGRIVIESLWQRRFALDELVNRITPANRHEEVNFGSPVGGSDVLR